MELENRQAGPDKHQYSHNNTLLVYLENSIMMPEKASEEAKRAEIESESFGLRRKFLELAKAYCEELEIEPETRSAIEAFDEANNTANSIVYSYIGLPFSDDARMKLSPERVRDKLALRVPHHVLHLTDYIKSNGKLGVPQDWLSNAAGEYVNNRFKSAEIDRVLLQALTQVEISAYIDEMMSKDVLTGKSVLDSFAPPSISKAILNTSQRISLALLIGAILIIAPLFIQNSPADEMLLIGIGAAGLGTIFALGSGIVSVTTAIRERPARKKAQMSILDTIDKMNAFYLEFKGQGPFSLARFKNRANDLANEGVVWPSGLFVLIEDMEERNIRMF